MLSSGQGCAEEEEVMKGSPGMWRLRWRCGDRGYHPKGTNNGLWRQLGWYWGSVWTEYSSVFWGLFPRKLGEEAHRSTSLRYLLKEMVENPIKFPVQLVCRII